MTATRKRLAKLAGLPPSVRRLGRPKLETLSGQWDASQSLQAEFDGNVDVYLAYEANKHRCRMFDVRLNKHGELLSGALPGLSFRNVQGSYFWGLESTERDLWTRAVASDMNSDQAHEIYKWLGNVPAMEKFAGERRRQQMRDFQLTVVNDKFENTIEVDVDDARRDKTGQVDARVSELGVEAAALPQDIFTTLLEGNGNGYDGTNFYANSHNHGGVVDNLRTSAIADPDNPTSAEMVAAILGDVQALYGFTNDRGRPCNQTAMEFAVVVPTKYWAAAHAALSDDFTAAGVSNTLQGVMKKGLKINVFVNPLFNGSAAAAGRRFYTFRTDAPVRAMIWQEEDIGDAFKVLGPESSEGFWKDQMAFGGKRIGNGKLGRFELTTRHEFAAA